MTDRKRSLLGLLAGLPGLLLAACEGEVPTTVIHYKQANLLESLLVYASTSGPVLTIVHGTPFGSQKKETLNAVLEEFARTVSWRKTAFTAEAATAPHPEHRVVVAFNAPESLDGRALCRGDHPATDANAPIRVRAVFCGNNEMISDVSGRLKTATGPGDQMFRKLLSQVARDLLDHR